MEMEFGSAEVRDLFEGEGKVLISAGSQSTARKVSRHYSNKRKNLLCFSGANICSSVEKYIKEKKLQILLLSDSKKLQIFWLQNFLRETGNISSLAYIVSMICLVSRNSSLLLALIWIVSNHFLTSQFCKSGHEGSVSFISAVLFKWYF